MAQLQLQSSFAAASEARRRGSGTISTDDRIPFAPVHKVLIQFANNLAILKMRVLGCVGVQLTADEEALALRDDREALGRMNAAAMDELRFVEETLRKASGDTAEGRVLDSVNSIYRFTYEEIALRFQATEDERQARFASQKQLTVAVDHQRRMADAADEARRASEARAAALAKELEDCRRRIKLLEREKKDDFDSYIKEVCVLKEQLLHSYKDKDFVGKPVDMLRFVVDNDTAEDVSVDELLKARRFMRNAEKEAEALKERIQSLTADVSSKNRQIKRTEERLRASEGVTTALQGDIEALNEALTASETRCAATAKDVKRLQSTLVAMEAAEALRKERRADADSQTEEPKRAVSKYDEGAELIPESHREKSRLQLFRLYGEQTIEIDRLKAEHEKFAKEGMQRVKNLEAEIARLEEERDSVRAELAAANAELARRQHVIDELKLEIEDLHATIKDLERERDAAFAAKAAAEAERDRAIEAKLVAEERAGEAVQRCATLSRQVTSELATLTKALEVAQQRNAALCQAFLNVSERLEEIKTRAGLKDYKRRANEFHFKRAEAAIQAARDEMARHEAACREREAAAAAEAATARLQRRLAEEDLRERTRLQELEVKALQERTAAVQDAFEALLQDFNRLRDDYLKTAGGTAAEYLKGWSANDAAQRAAAAAAAASDAADNGGSGAQGQRRPHEFVFEAAGRHNTPAMTGAGPAAATSAAAMSAHHTRLIATIDYIHRLAADPALVKTSSDRLAALRVEAARPEIDEEADDDAALLAGKKPPGKDPKATPTPPTPAPAAAEVAPARINEVALLLADATSGTFAACSAALQSAFAQLQEWDAFIAEKRQAIEAKLAAATAAGGSHTRGGTKGKPGSADKNARGAAGTGSKLRKSLAADHARSAAMRHAESERAGLEQERVLVAWDKLRLLQAMDAAALEAVRRARELFAASGIGEMTPALPTLPDAVRLPPASVADAPTPKEEPVPSQPASPAPPAPLPSIVSQDDELKPDRSMAARSSGVQSPARPAPGRSTSAVVPTPLGALGFDTCLAATDEDAELPSRPPRRTASLPNLAALDPSLSPPPARWGMHAPAVTPEPLSRYSILRDAMPARSGTPAASAVRIRPGMLPTRSELTTQLPDLPHIERGGSPAQPSTRPGTTHHPLPDGANDAFLGDHVAVDLEFERLRASLTTPAGTSSGGLPAWQRQKNRLRAASRGTASGNVEPLPAPRTGGKPPRQMR